MGTPASKEQEALVVATIRELLRPPYVPPSSSYLFSLPKSALEYRDHCLRLSKGWVVISFFSTLMLGPFVVMLPVGSQFRFFVICFGLALGFSLIAFARFRLSNKLDLVGLIFLMLAAFSAYVAPIPFFLGWYELGDFTMFIIAAPIAVFWIVILTRFLVEAFSYC